MQSQTSDVQTVIDHGVLALYTLPHTDHCNAVVNNLLLDNKSHTVGLFGAGDRDRTDDI